MKHDANLVARKLETYFDQNETHHEKEIVKKDGVLKNLLCITLMSLALALTKTSLFLTRLVKKLEA